MTRKTTHEVEKEAKPIVGTQIPMQEGQAALEDFEKLAKRIFTVKATKNE